MKVAVVIPKYGLVGGAENFVFELCERIAANEEFQLHVFANQWRQGKAPVTYHKVPIIPFPRWIRPVSFAYFARKSIQTGFFEIVHSHDRIFEMDIFTFHGIPHKTWVKKTKKRPLSLFDRSTAWVEKKGINCAKAPVILPVSNLVKDELNKRYDIPEPKLHVIHPGVSLERFSAFGREHCRHAIRQRHGLSPKDVVVLFVSMNFELKRLDLVLKGIAGVVEKEKRNSNFKLLVVGRGDVKRFGALARDLGILDRVIFAGVTHEVEKYYLAADIFALPSRFDTFGLVVLEAMAAGLPVIITCSVGARDLVEPGINGFVLSEDPSVFEMTASLSSMMELKKRMQMGENSRRIALNHTWDKTADRVADLYHQLAIKRNT